MTMFDKLLDELRQFNKFLGALAGGGLITALVALHVIPASVGNTILTIIGVAGAAVGALLAASNKTPPSNELPVDETDDAALDPDPAPADIDVNDPAVADDPDQPPAGQPPSTHVPQHAAALAAEDDWPVGSSVPPHVRRAAAAAAEHAGAD